MSFLFKKVLLIFFWAILALSKSPFLLSPSNHDSLRGHMRRLYFSLFLVFQHSTSRVDVISLGPRRGHDMSSLSDF